MASVNPITIEWIMMPNWRISSPTTCRLLPIVGFSSWILSSFREFLILNPSPSMRLLDLDGTLEVASLYRGVWECILAAESEQAHPWPTTHAHPRIVMIRGELVRTSMGTMLVESITGNRAWCGWRLIGVCGELRWWIDCVRSGCKRGVVSSALYGCTWGMHACCEVELGGWHVPGTASVGTEEKYLSVERGDLWVDGGIGVGGNDDSSWRYLT